MSFSGTDETLNCCDCRQPFIFTVGEQQFFDSKGLTERPKRCKPCRQIKKQRYGDGGNAAGPASGGGGGAGYHAPTGGYVGGDDRGDDRGGGKRPGGGGKRRERGGGRRRDSWDD